MIFEEFLGALLVERNSLPRGFANIPKSRRNGRQFASLAMPVLQRAAASEKCGKSGCMIVVGPAVELRPLERFILGIRKDDWSATLAQSGHR